MKLISEFVISLRLLDGMVVVVGLLGFVYVYRIVKIGDLLAWLPGRWSIEVN